MIVKKRIKVVIDGEVLVTPHFSGIGHYTLEMLRAIDMNLDGRPLMKVYVFVYFRRLAQARAYAFRNIGIIPSPFSLRVSNALKIRGKQLYLDLFFGKGTYLFPNFTSWPLARSLSVPIIYDLSYEKYPQYAEPRNQAFLSTQVKIAAERADFIATISKNSKNEINEFYNVPMNKIGVFYPAVDQRRFFRRPLKDISNIKKKYKVKGSYILFVGNIEPRKNIKNILLAYEALDKNTRKKYSLLLVGAKGWQNDEIFEIIGRINSEKGAVQIPDKYVLDDDLPALFSGASVFVYPSMYEGFGIPPLEAMACGVPVVSANNSSLPEATGGAGLLIDALSSNDISKAIMRVLVDENLSERLVADGYAQVDRFSWDRTAKELLDSIERINS